MGKKLYVGNLAFDVTGKELEALFAQAGICESVAVITDRATGQSRGFGFVEMGSNADAQQAMLRRPRQNRPLRTSLTPRQRRPRWRRRRRKMRPPQKTLQKVLPRTTRRPPRRPLLPRRFRATPICRRQPPRGSELSTITTRPTT